MSHYLNDMQAIVPSYPLRRSFQPGKKTILVAVCLSFLLVMSQVFCSLRLDKPTKLSVSSIHQALNVLNDPAEPPPCLKNFLGDRKHPPKPPDTCHHLKPPRGICSLISELFYEKNPPNCKHQDFVEFCKMTFGSIDCRLPPSCASDSLSLGVFNSTVGKLMWSRISHAYLEPRITAALKSPDYKGFLFIECSEHIQLFMEPPQSNKPYQYFTKKFVDINIIMLDSLSRNHFYRSLPNTVNFMSDIVSSGTSKIKVLDFEFVQSIKQRTYENLQALFSGFVNLNQKSFGTLDIPDIPLPLHVMLKKFKERNFKTLWLEDLCWSWEWGLSKDLKVVNKTLSDRKLWESFKRAINSSYIDGVDVSLASCKILDYNERNDPFRDTPAVCLNGKFHHEYLLEYLQKYQMTNQKQNLFTFTQTNVAHDETGIRVQSLDKSLEKYLKFASKLENTVTILLSDHGNTYGHFLEESPEAYVETFNPFLFMIIPPEVRKQIGDVKFRVLQDNQDRLITMIDLHEALLSLINATNSGRDSKFIEKYVNPKGLLSMLPSLRTCNDLPIIMPNLCICQNYDVAVPTKSKHFAFAEFSVAVMNNFIVNQRHKSGKKGFGNCQLLIANRIRSAKEVWMSADVISYKIDVEVTGILSEHKEKFFFNVEVGMVDPTVRLVSYERLSLYSKFSGCADDGVALKLCICEPKKLENQYGAMIRSFLLPSFLRNRVDEMALNQVEKFMRQTPPSVTVSIDFKYPKKDPCVYVVKHDFGDESFNIFGISVCSTFHKISLRFYLTNVLISDDIVSHYLIRPFDVKILISGTRGHLMLGSNWSYDISVL